MQFKNNVTNTIREFNERYVRLPNKDELAKEFLIANKDNPDTKWSFKTGETFRNINQVAQVKVNIRDIGAIIANFDPAYFNKDTRTELFNKLLTLKEIDTSKSLDAYKRKVVSVFHYINDYHPYYVVVDFNDVARESELIISCIGFMDYQIFFVKKDYPEINIVIGPEDPIEKPKKPGFFARLFKGKEEEKKEEPKVEKVTTQVVKPVSPYVEPVKKEEFPPLGITTEEKQKLTKKFDFKGRMTRMFKNFLKNKIDYILNVLYSALIGITVLLSVIYMSIGNTGIGALFIGFSVVSVGLSVYNIFVFRKDEKDLDVFDNIFFVLFSIVGGIIGVLAGWLIAATLINKDDTQVDFVKTIAIGGGITPVAMALAEGLAILLVFIIKKFKKKK